VRQIVVAELSDETYRARLVLESDGRDIEVDARPSDAIALAVRAGVPIYATDEVMDRAAVTPEADDDEKLSVFREFVNSLDVDLPDPPLEGPEERRRLE
jgi:bifunctional DNase/RNase